MASLSKIGKFWYVSYYAIVGNKRRKKKVKGYTDKSATLRLANRLEDEKTAILSGDIDPQQLAEKRQRQKPIDQHIKEYERALFAKGNTENHVTWTIRNIRQFAAWSTVQFATEIERSMMDEWVLNLETSTPKKKPDTPKTINGRVASVQQFLRHLHTNGGVAKYVLSNYPKRKTKGKERRVYRHFTADEVDLLMAKTPSDERRDIYRFALLTGFRLNEIRSMTPASFNFDAATVTVRASDAKNKSKHQTIPLHADLIEDIKRRCDGAQNDSPIFRVPSKTKAAPRLRADCKAAGIDIKNVSFHGLRHTFVTRLAEANVHPKILQELARHSSLETTLKYYTHFRQADERAAIDSLRAQKHVSCV